MRLALLLLLFLTRATQLQAQPARAELLADARAAALARVDSLFWAADLPGSLAAAEALAPEDPDGTAAWRAARAAVVQGLMGGGDDLENQWYERGEAHALRALGVDSLSIDALVWLTAAKGRRAMQSSPREAARLGDEVWRLAHRVLALDPDHSGARNVLGKLQYEVMTLSRVERFLARRLLGANEALRSSSWEGAESELRRAVALAPDAVIYRYDLARALLRRDRRDEGVAELLTVLALPPVYPHDERVKEDARRQLLRLGVEP